MQCDLSHPDAGREFYLRTSPLTSLSTDRRNSVLGAEHAAAARLRRLPALAWQHAVPRTIFECYPRFPGVGMAFAS